jgi:hypothetical protein
MAHPTTPTDQQLDQQLADYTDQVLTGRQPTEKTGGSELESLQETVLLLNTAVRAARPDPTTAARMRKNVLSHWKRPTPAWQFPATWSRPAMVLAGLGALLLVAIALLLSTSGDQITGSAEGSTLFSALLIIAGLVLIFVLLRKYHH